MRAIRSGLQQLRALIDSGQYPRNGRLPPERELAEAFGVSRSSLRRALSVLEAEGVIQRHVGQGTFVRSSREQANEVVLRVEPASPAEIMEARKLLEPMVAASAAVNARASDIEQMRYCVEKSRGAADWPTYELWDTTLHRLIAESTHNAVLMGVLELVTEMRGHADWLRLSEAALSKGNQQKYSRQHGGIVKAIAQRDSAAAASAMRAHVESVETDVLRAGKAAGAA